MKNSGRRVRSQGFLLGIFFAFLFLPALTSGWAQSLDENSCVTCHSDLWEGMKTSVHSQNGILCQDCHGGDPAQLDFELAKAPSTGFIGKPTKKQMVQRCGECHGDVERMNFYGIRADQLARYKTSVHGKKLLLEGDEKVAACTDCHGSHHVVSVSDTNSPVYPLNLPNTCNQCHGDKKLMDQYHLPSDVFETYRTSVHGRALFEKKDLSVANCVSCHGSHGAVPPGVRHIGETCGKCHINEKKYFLESVHAPVMKEGKFSECISCHGNHGVKPADKILYRETCTQCHEKTSPPAQLGEKLFQFLSESEGELQATTQLVREASIQGIFVEEETGVLEETKTNAISMEPIQHSLSLERISKLYEKLREDARAIKASVQKKRQALKWRKLALIPIWIFVVVMALALWFKYRELHSSHEKEDNKKQNR